MYERNSKRPAEDQTAFAHFNSDINYPGGAISYDFLDTVMSGKSAPLI